MTDKHSAPGYQYFFADFFNLVIEALVYFLSFSPAVYWLMTSAASNPFVLTAMAILGWLLSAVIFIVVLVLIKRLLIREVPTGRFLLTSSRSFRWMFSDRLVKIMARSPFCGLVTENAFYRYLFYRGMGMQFDSTLLLGSRTVIVEPWSLKIGRNVLIGSDAVISGHKVERQTVTLENVTIGDNVLIGTHAIILPGVTIGNNVVIGANTVLQRGTTIPDGETWAGNPAQRLLMFGEKP
jgi:acetyltransferase-like isoleucine patch superfamily enzyme